MAVDLVERLHEFARDQALAEGDPLGFDLIVQAAERIRELEAREKVLEMQLQAIGIGAGNVIFNAKQKPDGWSMTKSEALRTFDDFKRRAAAAHGGGND